MPAKGLCLARCNDSDARIKVLDGTQPTLTHVPPVGKPSLMMVTFSAPSSTARVAAEKAAEPPPMIIKVPATFSQPPLPQQEFINTHFSASSAVFDLTIHSPRNRAGVLIRAPARSPGEPRSAVPPPKPVSGSSQVGIRAYCSAGPSDCTEVPCTWRSLRSKRR